MSKLLKLKIAIKIPHIAVVNMKVPTKSIHQKQSKFLYISENILHLNTHKYCEREGRCNKEERYENQNPTETS